MKVIVTKRYKGEGTVTLVPGPKAHQPPVQVQGLTKGKVKAKAAELLDSLVRLSVMLTS